MSLITDNFLEAIDIIVDKKISEAAYDRATVAEVKAITNKDKGIYQVQYQDSSFTAISAGDSEYRIGDQVYVLTPNNDPTQEHIILGKTSGSRNNNYEDLIVGNTVLKGFTKDCTVEGGKSLELIIYDYEQPQKGIATATLDQAALATYVQRSSSILARAAFTSIVDKKDTAGDYGFLITIQLKSGATQELLFNKNFMDDKRYEYKTPTIQTALFEGIDGQQFSHIKSIVWFVKGFNKAVTINFQNLELFGCAAIDEVNEVGAILELKAPSGTTFESLDGTDTYLPVQTRLKNKDTYISDTDMEYRFYRETPWTDNGWTRINDEANIHNPDITLSSADFSSYYQMLKCETKYDQWFYSDLILFQKTIEGSGWLTIEREDKNTICSLTAKLINSDGTVNKNPSSYKHHWVAINVLGEFQRFDETGPVLEIDTTKVDTFLNISVGIQELGAVARYQIAITDDKVVKDAIHLYAAYESDIEPPEDGVWQNKMPEDLAGYYLWSKVRYIYTDNSTAESDPIVTGASIPIALYTHVANAQEPDGNIVDKNVWSETILAPTAQDPEVYVTYGLSVNGALLVKQDWSDPILYSRYSVDGSTVLYRYAYLKTKGLIEIDIPNVDWIDLPATEGDPEKWYQVPVDLNKHYPFVYQCSQIETTKDGKVSYGQWSAPFLDRHWGEDYIYAYSYNKDAILPEVMDGNIQWGNNEWSSADLTIDEQHPIVYRITGIIEGNVMQKLDSDAGKSQYWTDPVVYKNYSLNLTLADKEYAVADFDNLDRVNEIENWSDVYPEIEVIDPETGEITQSNKGKYIWTKLTYSNNDIRYEITYIAKDGEPGQKGDDGNPTRDLSLKVDSYVIKKDKEGQLSPTKIIFDALVQNIDYTDGLLWKINDFPQVDKDQQLELIVDNDLFAKGDFKVSVEFANANEDLAQFKDEVTILCLEDGVDGESTFKVSCTNPVMLFNDTTQEENATFSVYYGTQDIAFNDTTKSMYWTIALTSDDSDDTSHVTLNDNQVTITDSDADDNYIFHITVYKGEEILYEEDFIIQTRIVSSVLDFTLVSSAIAVKEDKDGNLTPPTITLTPKPKNFKTPSGYAWDGAPEGYHEDLETQAITFDVTQDLFTTNNSLVIKCQVNDNDFEDTVTIIKIKDGDDTFSINLTNGTMTFNTADVDAQESTYVYAWHGGEQLAYGIGDESSGYTFTVEVEGAEVDANGQITVTNPQVKKEITGTAHFYNNGAEDESKQMTFIIHATIVENGIPVQDLNVGADAYVVVKKEDGSYSPDKVTLTAYPMNLGDNASYEWYKEGVSESIGSGETLTVSASSIGAFSKYTVKETISNLQDTLTLATAIDGATGKDGLVILLTNDNMTFNLSTTAHDETATLMVYQGGQKFVNTDDEYVKITGISNAAGAVESFTDNTVKISNVTTDGSCDVTIAVKLKDQEEFTDTRTINWTVFKDGESVKDITISASSLVVKKLKEEKNGSFYDPSILDFSAITTGLGNDPKITWSPTLSAEGQISAETLFGDNKSAQVTASVTVDAIEYKDSATIVLLEDGSDAYTVVNSNPAMVFNASDEADITETATITLYKGTTPISITSITGPDGIQIDGNRIIVEKSDIKATTQLSFTLIAEDGFTTSFDINVTLVSNGESVKDITLKVDTLTVKCLDLVTKDYEPKQIKVDAIVTGLSPDFIISPAPTDGYINVAELFTVGKNSATITVTHRTYPSYQDSTTIYALQDGINGEGAFAVVVDNPVMVFNKLDTDDVSETANVQVFMGTKEIDFIIWNQYDEDGNSIKSVTIHRGDLSEDYKTTFDYTIYAFPEGKGEGKPVIPLYFAISATLVNDGKDAISVINTNPSMQFNEKEEGASKTTTIEVWQGLTQLKIESISNGTISANGLSATITVQKPQSAGTQSYTVTAKDTEGNIIAVPIDISTTLVKDGTSSTIKSYYFGPTAIDSINNIPPNANWGVDDPSGETTEDMPYVYRKDVIVEGGIETNKFIIVAHFRFVKGEKGDTGNTISTGIMRAYWGTTDIGADTPTKPNGNTLGSWTIDYSAVYEYPYVYITECEVVLTYDPEGKQIGNAEYKTWSDAALYKVNGSDANVNLVNTFNALTQNGAQKGIYYTDDQDQPINGALTENSKVKHLFINASMIKTGYLDANTLLAGEIRVGDKFYVKLDKDINGTDQDSDIKLAGFLVNNSQIYSNTRIGQTAWDSTENGICIDSNNGIRLGKGNAFEVTAEGALTATKAHITGEIKATSGWFGSEASGVEINSNGIYKSGIFQLGANSSIGGLNITANGLEYQSNGSSVIIKTYDEGNKSSTIISDTAEFNTAIFGDKTSSAPKWRFTRTSDGSAFYLEHDDGLQFSGEGLYYSKATGTKYITWDALLGIATGGAATTIDKVAGLQNELNNRYTKAEILTINDNGQKSGVLADYYTITEANSQINASIDASVTPELQKLQQADTDTNDKFQNYSTTTEMNAAIEKAVKTVDLSNYYTKSETYKKSEVEALIQSSVGYVLTNSVTV